MKPSKFHTHVAPRLADIAAWSAAGLPLPDIARRLDLQPGALRRYLDLGRQGLPDFVPLAQALDHPPNPLDQQVEDALHRCACGFSYTLTTTEEKLDRNGQLYTLTKREEKVQPPELRCMELWLKTRRPDLWCPPEPATTGQDGSPAGVVLIPAVEPEPGGGDEEVDEP